MENHLFKISSKKKLGTHLYLQLVPESSENIKYVAGQFVKIISPNKKEDPKFRFYSIASSPDQKYLEFFIDVIGKFSSHLDSLELDDILEIQGPMGHFKLSGENKIIFVAGGSGIAPVMSLIRDLYHKNKQGEFILFFSNKDSNIPYYEELLEISKDPNFNVIFTITREFPDDWKFETGRIDSKMILNYINPDKSYSAFICGSVKFATSMRKMLCELGLLDENIRIESWG